MKRASLRLIAGFGVCCGVFAAGAARAETTVCDGGGVAGSGAGKISAVPFTISAPGVYCLTQKISSTLTSGAAIAINANNVVLDLNGYAIGNLAAGPATSAVGIYAVDRQNIVVRNGILRGFWGCITLVHGTTVGLTTALSSGHVVEGVTADTCYLTGIAVEGPYAVVRSNKVMNTKGSAVATVTGLVNAAVGISVVGADALVVHNVVVDTDCSNGCANTATKGAIALGIGMASAPSSVVENNTISNHAMPTVTGLGSNAVSAGIYIYQYQHAGSAGSTNVFVISNQLANWEYGIFYQPANGGTTTVASTGDFLLNGTQTVTTPYVGGTNINLNSGMNF
jgi:hypothetical protein